MSISWTAKDPDEVDTRAHDFSALMDTGETVTTYTITPIAGTVTATKTSNDDSTAQFEVSGGAAGETSVFDVTIVTSAGRTLNETIILPVVSTAPTELVTAGYIAPSTANLVAAFPAFSATPQAALDMALAAAAGMVDDSWLEADFAEAQLLYAAHWLTMNGHGSGPAAQVASLAGVKRIKSGALDVEFSDGGVKSALGSTSYGERFLVLLRRSKGGPRVVTGTVAYAPPPIILN